MRIGGLQKCSLIDFPGHVACVVFTQGCNFRCPYCHNRELVDPRGFQPTIAANNVLEFLVSRRRYLTGVVVSGGEPTIQRDLIAFMRRVRSLGYAVKLDTNGSRPDVLRRIIEAGCVDYIAMDIKALPEKYGAAIGGADFGRRVEECIALIEDAGIAHQFRTTVVRPFCTLADTRRIRQRLKPAANYCLQSYQAGPDVLNPAQVSQRQYPSRWIQSAQSRLNRYTSRSHPTENVLP